MTYSKLYVTKELKKKIKELKAKEELVLFLPPFILNNFPKWNLIHHLSSFYK